MDRVQLFQEVAAMDEHAVPGPDTLVHPFRGIGAGPDRIAPGEARFVLAGEARHAAGPEQEAGEIAQRLARHRQPVHDGAAETHVGILRVAMLARRDEQLAARIAARDLAHHSGDAGLHRRKFAGQEKSLSHGAVVPTRKHT